jgi:hypothetical protein
MKRVAERKRYSQWLKHNREVDEEQLSYVGGGHKILTRAESKEWNMVKRKRERMDTVMGRLIP